jgi:hypothetical protein
MKLNYKQRIRSGRTKYIPEYIWGKGPFSGYSVTPYNKTLCRRIERRNYKNGTDGEKQMDLDAYLEEKEFTLLYNSTL